VADLVRGKTVAEALTLLKFSPRRSAPALVKLIKSAADNAVNNQGADREKLFIKSITVDKGLVLKRFMPRARGSASRINRRQSRLNVELAERPR